MIRQVLLAVFFIGKFFRNMYGSVSTYTRYGSGDNYKYEQFSILEMSMKNSSKLLWHNTLFLAHLSLYFKRC